MDAINQLHKEMYDGLAYREENGYKIGNFNRWISLCEMIENGFQEQQEQADDLTRQFFQLKRKYEALTRWINAIGEKEELVFTIPDEFLEKRTLRQQANHLNNPWQLWEDAMHYRNDAAKRNYFNHSINLILNERTT